MFKRLAIVSAVVMLSACSSMPFGDKRVQAEDSVTAEFMGGDLKITYTKDGKFESMTAAGTARVTSTLPSATEEAFIVANLRAKQKVVEFMKNELEGDVQENIKSKTKAILQGVYVESKKFDTATNTVRVVVKTGTKDIQTAKEMRMLMGN